MHESVLTAVDRKSCKAGLHGELILPGDEDYDSARRVWNFGIVTAFEFQLHPIGPVLAGKVVYPLAKAREVLRFYRDYTRSAPDELTVYTFLITTSAGLLAISISLCYCGPLDEGGRLVEQARSFSVPVAETIGPKTYFKVITQANAGAPDGRSYYQKASTLATLSDEVIDTIAASGAACTSPCSQVLIQHMHGVASRVGPTETAFALRDESYVVSIVAAWEDGQAEKRYDSDSQQGQARP